MMPKIVKAKTIFLKCPGCGRIHVGISEREALAEVRRFNEYYERLSPSLQQSDYGGRCASIDRYRTCRYCETSSQEFIPAIGFENSGVTMQPIIAPAELLGNGNDMHKLIKYRLARSDECLRDGDYLGLSRPSRLRCYFDAGYFQILSAIERVDPEAIADKSGWDFDGVLKSAGKNLALSKEDVTMGIELSEAAHLMPPDEPDDFELAAAREWAVRVAGCVRTWMGQLPA
jgi:hypothetical protein